MDIVKEENMLNSLGYGKTTYLSSLQGIIMNKLTRSVFILLLEALNYNSFNLPDLNHPCKTIRERLSL